MRRLSVPIGVVIAALAGVGSAFGFVGQRTGVHELRWASDLIRFTIHEVGEPTIGDGSDSLAVRLAFRAWETADSRLRFLEDTDPAQRARRDWRSDDVHLVVWDETNESGLFGNASGLVAVTPIDFNPHTGEILDADVLLNGQRPFATNLSSGAFDVQSIVTHEVGHFLGLDHSPIEGSTMTPITAHGDTRLRSLEADDRAAIAARYPVALARAVIEGTVLRGGRPVRGAHVVAESDSGEPVSSTLTDAQGRYQIEGLAAGSYAVYAEPLNGRVTSAHLQTRNSGQAVDTDFGATFFGANGRSSPAQPERVTVASGQTVRLRAIEALEAHGMRLTQLWSERLVPGQTLRLLVSGDGLANADSFVVPARSGEILATQPQFTVGTASAALDVSGNAETGLRTVRVFRSDTWACATLTGRLEVRAPRPAIRSLSATAAVPGDQVRVDGDGFLPGARVLLGSSVATSWASGASLEVVIPQLPNGKLDLVIENPDGQATVFRGFVVQGSATVPPPAPGTTPAAAPAPGTRVESGVLSPGRSKSGTSSSSGCSLGATENAPFSAVAIVALLLLLTLRREDAEPTTAR